MVGMARHAGDERAVPTRCAIYTRKSSEEGLGQEFNSLEAQRESAEAYILSQRHAGWTVLERRYDDGGYTGANLERPALERLLADIETGSIDCVIVYKVDRLSRSLLDFARLMGIFEKRNVSLVSVTQQFNTTASLGRLTLNILLSFAQFEREIIAERTHDKMSAARRKGKWMGGIPVLGYDVAAGGGKLAINEAEAQRVRAIYSLYLEHESLLPVLTEIEQRQWTTKRWATKKGNLHPGRSFKRNDLMGLLANAIYVGKVRHQGQMYLGEHAGIVEEGVWQRVQDALSKEPFSKLKWGRQPLRPSTPPPEITHPQQRGYSPGPEQATAPGECMPGRVPRITRLLALAIKFEGLLRQGVVKDYAELARLGHVSRARITQVMNLLYLAPDIQEEILFAQNIPGNMSIRETSVRRLSSEVSWSRQREQMEKMRAENDNGH